MPSYLKHTHLNEANTIFDYSTFLGIKTQERLNLETYLMQILPK